MLRLKNWPLLATTLKWLPAPGANATHAMSSPAATKFLITWWHSSGMFRLKNRTDILWSPLQRLIVHLGWLALQRHFLPPADGVLRIFAAHHPRPSRET